MVATTTQQYFTFNQYNQTERFWDSIAVNTYSFLQWPYDPIGDDKAILHLNQ